MARIHTHYDNLKVARDAPPEVIRAAYKTLSQKYHPDRNQNSPEAIRIIQMINSAYEVLSDPDKRSAHDRWILKSEVRQEAKKPMTPPPPKTAPTGARRAAPSKVRRQRSGILDAMERFEAAMDNFFKTLLRKMRPAPQPQNGRHR